MAKDDRCLLCEAPIVVDFQIGTWSGIGATPPARFLCSPCAAAEAGPGRDDREVTFQGEIFLRFGPYWAHTDEPELQYLYR